MKPKLVFVDTNSPSPLLTVIEECGVPSCMRVLSPPNPDYHDNNSSAVYDDSNCSASTGKFAVPAKTPAKAPAKTPAKTAAKQAAVKDAKKDAKCKVPAAHDSKEAVLDQAAKEEADLGMGTATMGNDATASSKDEATPDRKNESDSELAVDKSTNGESTDATSAPNVTPDKVQSKCPEKTAAMKDAKMKEAGKGAAKGAKGNAAAAKQAGKDTKVKDATRKAEVAKDAGNAVDDATKNAPAKENETEAPKGGEAVNKEALSLDKEIGKQSAPVAQDASHPATKDAGKGAKNEVTKKVPPTKDAKHDAKKKPLPGKDAGKGGKDLKKASKVMKEVATGAMDAPKCSTGSKDPVTNTVQEDLSSPAKKLDDAADGPVEDAKATPAAPVKEAEASKTVKTHAKTVSKVAKNPVKIGAKNSKTGAGVAKNSSATSIAHTALVTSSETDTFDAASSDSVEPMEAAARRLATLQATGESPDLEQFGQSAEAETGPTVDGMGEKRVAVPALESAPSSSSPQQQQQVSRSLDETTDPNASLAEENVDRTASSSTSGQSQEPEEVTPQAASATPEADVTDPSNQASTSETATSELDEIPSQSAEPINEVKEEQERQEKKSRERLERIKAEAVDAVRRFFSKNRPSAASARKSLVKAPPTKVSEYLMLSMEQIPMQMPQPDKKQQQKQPQQRPLDFPSCPMHVQIAEKAIELFELLELAVSQRRRKQPRPRSSGSPLNAANSAVSAKAAGAVPRRRSRRRHQQCDDVQDDISQSDADASATLSEAVLQEIDFEDVTEEEEEEVVKLKAPEKVAKQAAVTAPASAKRSKQSARSRSGITMPPAVLSDIRRNLRLR